jgi:hypothetical protein
LFENNDLVSISQLSVEVEFNLMIFILNNLTTLRNKKLAMAIASTDESDCQAYLNSVIKFQQMF